jgi:hypothetical protein
MQLWVKPLSAFASPQALASFLGAVAPPLAKWAALIFTLAFVVVFNRLGLALFEAAARRVMPVMSNGDLILFILSALVSLSIGVATVIVKCAL